MAFDDEYFRRRSYIVTVIHDSPDVPEPSEVEALFKALAIPNKSFVIESVDPRWSEE